MGKMIVCGSCAAEFDENVAKCPFCGSTNIKGAEREYLEKLEDVREDLEDLGDLSGKSLKTSMKRQMKRWRVLAIVLVLLVVALFALFQWADHSYYQDDAKAVYLWKNENFPKLDELYDAGDYDGLVTLYREMSREKNYLYDWSHYSFVSNLILGQDLMGELEECKESPDQYLLVNTFYDQWKMKAVLKHKSDYTESEWALLEPLTEASEEAFEQMWHLSAADMEMLETEFKNTQNNYMPFDVCKKFVNQWIKENQ